MGHITGNRAELKVGYQWAATLRNWSLTFDYKVAGRLDIDFGGVLEKADQFWITQGPMDLWAHMNDEWAWVWPMVIDGSPVVRSPLYLSGQGQPTVKRIVRA